MARIGKVTMSDCMLKATGGFLSPLSPKFSRQAGEVAGNCCFDIFHNITPSKELQVMII